MRSTTRGSLSFCAWRRTSSSLEMVALFPFANVGRILPIIAHFSEYVELFMRTYIVEAVRDAAEAIVRTDQTKVPTLVKLFRKRRLQVFLRLAHHLLRTFPDAAPELL